MSVSCKHCGAVAGYGHELGHKSSCPTLGPITPDDPDDLLGIISDLMSQVAKLTAERERVARAFFGEGWANCLNLEPYALSVAAQANLMGLIDVLRGEEGDSVTILCDNPEGPPNNAIECNGEWTGFENKRFEGETLSDALSAAHLECIQIRAAIAAGKKWSAS